MWEPKLDGYRALAFIDSKGVQLRSRRGLDLAKDFPALVAELGMQAVNTMVLDGEIVAFDAAGKPSFNAMQNRSQASVFYCFDLVNFEGIDLRKLAYAERRRYLAQCLLRLRWCSSCTRPTTGWRCIERRWQAGSKGVIGKRKDSHYESGKRSGAWRKVKATQSAEFVIGGYTTGKGARAALGAILVGYWDGGRLRYASHVGSGFDDRTISSVETGLAALRTERVSLSARKPPVNAPTQWVKPELVAEVKFQSWTDDGSLRAPVFLRLRDDIEPKEVTRREIANQPRPSRRPLK
jgi:bifunctional non-homologous end joining protein LigD